jgi:RNA polymerase sigma factor (sigma-70 family)
VDWSDLTTMCIDDRDTRDSLVRMVTGITSNPTLRKDLLQEALIHLWLTEAARPGQTKSWYIQGCKFHLLHYLNSGRSVDSRKRHFDQMEHVEELGEGMEHEWERGADDAVLSWVNARDLYSLLERQLAPVERKVLECLSEGMKAREIGRQLGISHTMVSRHRCKIAELLKRLEAPRPWTPGLAMATAA